MLHPIMDCQTSEAMFTIQGQHFFVNILCSHYFSPQKPHEATLIYHGTRNQGPCHL